MAKYDTHLIKDTARGQWAPLFAAIGIPQEAIDSATETACPKCGGGTRFRMVDRDARVDCSHALRQKWRWHRGGAMVAGQRLQNCGCFGG